MDLFKFNFQTIRCKFKGYQDQNMNFRSQQYRAWSDTTDVQASLTQNWCQRPLLFRVNTKFIFTMVWIVFLFCPMFQLKRLNSACSVLYLHRKSNTIVLMYVNLFFIKRINASSKTIQYRHSAADCYPDFDP